MLMLTPTLQPSFRRSNMIHTINRFAAKLNSARPWQLLALTFGALGLGGLLFTGVLADYGLPPRDPVTAIYKAWLLLGFACEMLIIDMVVFYRSRPGSTTDLVERRWREARRTFLIGIGVLAGGLAL